MGVAPSSALLGNLTVRRPVERALDVGTGSGILAVLAARHAERVVATDLSERALAFAAFNAGPERLRERRVSPGQLLRARRRRALRARQLEPALRDLAGHLVHLPRRRARPGRRLGARRARGARRTSRRAASRRCSQPGCTSPTATGRPRSVPWLDGSGCDAAAPALRERRPAHLRGALEPAAPDAGARRDARPLARPLPRARDRGTRLRRDLAPPPQRHELGAGRGRARADRPGRPSTSSGCSRRRTFSPRATCSTRGSCSSTATCCGRRCTSRTGNFQVKAAKISLDEGLGFEAGIDLYTAHLVSQLDGRRTLREAIELSGRRARAGGGLSRALRRGRPPLAAAHGGARLPRPAPCSGRPLPA